MWFGCFLLRGEVGLFFAARRGFLLLYSCCGAGVQAAAALHVWSDRPQQKTRQASGSAKDERTLGHGSSPLLQAEKIKYWRPNYESSEFDQNI